VFTVGTHGNTVGINVFTVGTYGNTIGINVYTVGTLGNTVRTHVFTVGSQGNTVATHYPAKDFFPALSNTYQQLSYVEKITYLTSQGSKWNFQIFTLFSQNLQNNE
jgi:hypothetical protein